MKLFVVIVPPEPGPYRRIGFGSITKPKAGPVTRRDIEFNAEGVTLRGWLYLPEDPTGPVPVVVMAHGFAGVKEQHLDKFAEVFAEAGLSALVFDNRNFGASEGAPRQEVDPVQQVRDYRHAVTFARTLPEVNRERIGAWGTSFGGGHVLVLGAIDRRVKCVVSQAPLISGSTGASGQVRPVVSPGLQARFDADREARFNGGPPAMIPIISEESTVFCALPGGESWQFFESARELAPTWRNEVTLRSREMARGYEPGAYISKISPTPLLMIVMSHDTLTPTHLALEAYERALEPKKLVLLPGDHYMPYVEAFDAASAAARDWFVAHLLGR